MKIGKKTFAAASFAIFALAVVLAYEGFEQLRYARWHRSFDNSGWLGKVTVPSENPELLWEYRPYGRHGSIELNRYGFRQGDTVRVVPEPPRVRVAFIGDSVTLGLGVSAEESFVQRFEELEAGRVEALNFGVDGYDASQVRELLRSRVLPFHPDLVVYSLSPNDFDSRYSSGLKSLYFRRPRWFLGLKVEEAYRKLTGQDFHAFYFEKNRQRVFREILTMKGLADRAGCELLVSVLPVFYDSWSEDYPLHGMNQAILKFLAESSIPALDLLGSLTAGGEAPGELSLDLWHPNPRGHRRIARELFAWPELAAAISRVAAEGPGSPEKLQGGLDHRGQGPGVGEALTGDVEGRSVVDGGA